MTAAIWAAMSTPSPAYTSPGGVTIGIRGRVLRLQPRGALGAGGAHEVGAQQLHLPVGGEAEAHQLGRRQQVHGGPGLRIEARELELDRQRGRLVDRGVDAGHVRAHQRRQGARRSRAPRARPRGACRACASGGRRAARPGPANSARRPAVARRKNSSCQSRSWPWQKPSAKHRSCGVRAETWGTPNRSRRISIGASTPRSIRRPAVFGSGRRNSWYQSEAPASAAMAPEAVSARVRGFPITARLFQTAKGRTERLPCRP